MYRYYEKNGYNVMHYVFDSITEYLDYLDKQKTSEGFRYSSLSSQQVSDEGTWEGTKTYEEAKQLAKYGYKENYDTFINLKNQLDSYIKVGAKRIKQFNDYIGYVPDVKAYLEGSPLCMINKKNPARKQIDIYFNVAVSCGTNTKQIYNRGVIILSLIDLLEKKGFSVNLKLFDMTSDGNQLHYSEFRLKNTDERANPSKLYFPMCHNAWLRRLWFRLLEVTPDVNSSWTSGYGTPCDDYTIRKMLELGNNDIVIPQPREIGIRGNDIIEDTNKVFSYIESYTHEKVELEHIKRLKK